MIILSNSVHLFARPGSKEKLISFFTNILGLEVLMSSDVVASYPPIIAVKFPNGSSLSVEFTEDALDDIQARRGAWLELKSDNAPALMEKVLAAGLPRVEFLGNNFFYFQAPGGQVMRIASTSTD